MEIKTLKFRTQNVILAMRMAAKLSLEEFDEDGDLAFKGIRWQKWRTALLVVAKWAFWRNRFFLWVASCDFCVDNF